SRSKLFQIIHVGVIDERPRPRQDQMGDERVSWLDRGRQGGAGATPAGYSVGIAAQLNAVPVDRAWLFETVDDHHVGRLAAGQQQERAWYLDRIGCGDSPALEHVSHRAGGEPMGGGV